MEKIYCESCKEPHFNNYACSCCGLSFSSCYPKVRANVDLLMKYCPHCGHKFSFPDGVSEESLKKTPEDCRKEIMAQFGITE